jgi:NAD(P)H dehydrogenase (quinone)
VRDTIVQGGRIALPFGNGRHAPIAADDQARFIAAVLAQPASHIGKTYQLCGPIELSQQEIADKISEVLDRNIVYKPSTLEGYREHLSQYDLPEFTIQHFIEVAVDYQNGVFEGTDDIIGQVTGKAPQSIEEFVQANRRAFEKRDV